MYYNHHVIRWDAVLGVGVLAIVEAARSATP
jgi:hypothetical protein